MRDAIVARQIGRDHRSSCDHRSWSHARAATRRTPCCDRAARDAPGTSRRSGTSRPRPNARWSPAARPRPTWSGWCACRSVTRCRRPSRTPRRSTRRDSCRPDPAVPIPIHRRQPTTMRRAECRTRPAGCSTGRWWTDHPADCHRRRYGMRLSVATWYICAIGSCMRRHVWPRFSVIDMPPSWLTIMRCAVGRIDPDVVMIATGSLRDRRIDDRLAAVERLRPVGRQEIRLIRIVGHRSHAIVVVRAPRHLLVVAHHLPLAAAVVGAPQPAARRLLDVRRRHAVTGFDQRVNRDSSSPSTSPARSCRSASSAARCR